MELKRGFTEILKLENTLPVKRVIYDKCGFWSQKSVQVREQPDGTGTVLLEPLSSVIWGTEEQFFLYIIFCMKTLQRSLLN